MTDAVFVVVGAIFCFMLGVAFGLSQGVKLRNQLMQAVTMLQDEVDSLDPDLDPETALEREAQFMQRLREMQ